MISIGRAVYHAWPRCDMAAGRRLSSRVVRRQRATIIVKPAPGPPELQPFDPSFPGCPKGEDIAEAGPVVGKRRDLGSRKRLRGGYVGPPAAPVDSALPRRKCRDGSRDGRQLQLPRRSLLPRTTFRGQRRPAHATSGVSQNLGRPAELPLVREVREAILIRS